MRDTDLFQLALGLLPRPCSARLRHDGRSRTAPSTPTRSASTSKSTFPAAAALPVRAVRRPIVPCTAHRGRSGAISTSSSTKRSCMRCDRPRHLFRLRREADHRAVGEARFRLHAAVRSVRNGADEVVMSKTCLRHGAGPRRGPRLLGEHDTRMWRILHYPKNGGSICGHQRRGPTLFAGLRPRALDPAKGLGPWNPYLNLGPGPRPWSGCSKG